MLLSSFLSQQQSARYFSPHERNNASPAEGNLTALNSVQCFPPPTENLLNRPSCLTCPTIGDHPSASAAPPHPSHFHPFHHNSMLGPSSQQLQKNLMVNQHAIYDSCQRLVTTTNNSNQKLIQILSFDHDNIGRSRNDSLEECSGNFPDYFSECVKKEAITPPGSIKNNNNSIHNNNNESDGSSSILQLKTEPIGNPDSPESTSIDHPQPSTSADDCAGCGRLIQVKKDLNLKSIYLFVRLAR